MISFKILLFCFGDQHLIFGDLFVPDGRQKVTKEKIELGTLPGQIEPQVTTSNSRLRLATTCTAMYL